MLEFMKIALICGTVLMLAGLVLVAMPQSKLRDALKPAFAWLFIVACGFYVICPIDVLPDVVPVAGWVDDGGAAIAGVATLMSTLKQARERRRGTA